jgi:hypothetical protein
MAIPPLRQRQDVVCRWGRLPHVAHRCDHHYAPQRQLLRSYRHHVYGSRLHHRHAADQKLLIQPSRQMQRFPQS